MDQLLSPAANRVLVNSRRLDGLNFRFKLTPTNHSNLPHFLLRRTLNGK